MLGFSVSFTVTLKTQLSTLPQASVAVTTTGVVPTGKLDPEAGEIGARFNQAYGAITKLIQREKKLTTDDFYIQRT